MLKKIVNDREFLKDTLKIAVPVTLQGFIASSLNTLDTFMITTLGTEAIAGVGIANQVFFFFSMILFGITTGASVLISQFYGKEDYVSVKKSLGHTIKLSVLVSVVFTALALAIPSQIIALFIDDALVVEVGSNYLKWVSISYTMTALSFAIGIGMRSTGNARTPFIASLVSFFANAFFNYCFIFGKFGMPRMGVAGAAIGTIIARALEFLLLAYVLVAQKGPLYDNFYNLIKSDLKFFSRFSVVVSPVILEELFWGLAQVLYNMFYAKIGVDATAAVQVAMSISNMLYIFAKGLAGATTVIVGTKIGADEIDRAQDIAKKSLLLGATIGGALGLILIVFGRPILRLYRNLTPTVFESAWMTLIVLGIFYFVRVYNSVSIVGVLRGGGDIKFSFKLEMFTSYCVGLPMAALAVLVFHLPLHYTLAMISLEEVVKMLVSTPRILSKKWIKNLT